MPQTGWINFTSFAGTNWTTPTNAALSDNTYATYNTTTQDFLNCENASVAIRAILPATGAIIRGIEVSIEGNGDNATAANRQIEVFLTKDGAAQVGTGKVVTLNLTTDTITVIGGVADLWGTDVDLLEARATTFGLYIRDNDVTAFGLDLDHVMIKIHFDEGFRGMWDLNYDGFAEFSTPRQTYLDGWLNYDGGASGTTPAIGDMIHNSNNAVVARIIRPADANTIVFGTLTLGDLHHEDGGESQDPSPPFDDNDALTVLDYVDFDGETGPGVSESDIGSTMSGGTLSGAVIRHVENHGTVGRVWYTTSSGTLADTNAFAIPSGGSTAALANGASVANVWTGLANGTIEIPKQGYFDYDAEVTAFESSSGSERIRSSNAQHNMCVVASSHVDPKWTAMMVDDRPDLNAPLEGRLYVHDIDDSTPLANDDTVEALEEIDFDTETAFGPFVIDDLIGESGAPSNTARVRRFIDNGDGTGTLYVEFVGGVRWVDNDAIFVGANQVATGVGAQRQRVGEVTVNGTFTTAQIQWMNSHNYTDMQAVAPVLVNTDDATPMSAQVLDVQYTYLNQFTTSHFSTRRMKKGSVKQIGDTGAADDDSIYTDYRSIQTLANNLDANDPIAYAEQPAGTALSQFWDAGLVSAVIRNQEDNAKIDSGNVTWYFREWGTLFTHVTLTQVGGQPPITGDTFTDSANTTVQTTVSDTTAYQNIRLSFASHLVEFDGGGGTMVISDVLYNATRTSAAMVVAVPASQTAGTDLHVASDGQDITDWVDADALVTLTRLEFDTVVAVAGNALVFAVGDGIDNGAGVSAVVRLVRQYGDERGTIWVSAIAGGSFANNDPIEVGATQYALMDGAEIAGSGWTGDVHTAGAAADITVLKDIGNGTDNPYNVVVDCDGQTVQVMYEFMKFLPRRESGGPVESGGLLYPNNTLKQGRFYQKADSAYGAVDTNKQAPFGSKAAPAANFFGARGIFIENMDAADVQAYQLIDSDGTTRNPPNLQSSTVTGTANLDAVAQYRRPAATPSLTYAVGPPATITRAAGDFLDDGFRPKTTITISNSASNDGDLEVDSLTATVITLKAGETVVAEGPLTDDIEGQNVNRDQFSGDGSGNNLGDGDFDTTAALPTDLPSTGTLIVVHKDGTEAASGFFTDVYTFASYTGEIFTFGGDTLLRTYDGDARAFVPMLYEISAGGSVSIQIIYSADFQVITRVRQKGIIPFELLGTFTSTGLTTAAIRTTDTIVE